MTDLKITTIKAFTKDPKMGNPALVIEAPLDSQEALEAIRSAHHSVGDIIVTIERDQMFLEGYAMSV